MKAVAANPQEESVPTHVAIIMDGNGRWAQARNLPRTAGHKKGVDAVRTIVETAAEIGVSYLTLFGFSTENWKRPSGEVNDLMGLLRLYLKKEVASLAKNGICLKIIGDRKTLPPDIRSLISESEEKTANGGRLTLVIALSYGGRADITQAVQKIAQKVALGKIEPSAISEEMISSQLSTGKIPDPDLVIRTSGEQRISNFLLWQSAYAEFLFEETLWPDFNREAFLKAIDAYQLRERRFGATSV